MTLWQGEGPSILLAHGAGAGMDSPFMEGMAERLVARGLRVGRFDFPYMVRAKAEDRKRPPDRAPKLMDALREAYDAGAVVGGKSMGGRIASMLAEELGAPALVCLGYPFHPPGKPEKTRIEHLKELGTPTLIVQGERDPFGREAEVRDYPLSGAIRVLTLKDGDHSLKPRKASGLTQDEHLDTAADAIAAFVKALQ